jgi:hypothetical protein
MVIILNNEVFRGAAFYLGAKAPMGPKGSHFHAPRYEVFECLYMHICIKLLMFVKTS